MPIHFMLTQDGQSGKTIREEFANINAVNVKVGTFDIFLDLLLEYWLLPALNPINWTTKLNHAALRATDAFWAESIKTDEKSVIEELDTSLQILLSALPLTEEKLPVLEANEHRYTCYYNDLHMLHQSMEYILPEALAKAHLWYKNSDLKPLEEIIVYSSETLYLEDWQWEIVHKLNAASLEPSYQDLYTKILLSNSEHKEEDIKYLQESLFSENIPSNTPKIKNLQWLVARDVQQEVEVVAGMVQEALKEGTSFDNIAIVIPRDGWYKDFLIQTCSTFNIPLSRAGQIEAYADFGTQWIFNALQAQDKFSAPMLFASLFSSPLMPYSLADAQYLGRIALDNDWKNKHGNIKPAILEKFDVETQSLIVDIVEWQQENMEQSLNEFIKQLEMFYPLLNNSDNMLLHRKRFIDLIGELNTYLENFENATASELLNQIRPYALQENSERKSYLNSIHVVYEGDLMIQEIDHLFVLGFNDGHYPKKLDNVGVFSRMNWGLLANDIQLSLSPQEKFYTQEKYTFKRQLQCACKSITFMASALDLQGSTQSPSSSLSDIAYCFYHDQKELEPELLLTYLEEEKTIPFFYATASKVEVEVQRDLISEDLNLGKNIFELRKNEDGTLKPESPSSLEKLMISPLSWFLYRQGLEPKIWGVLELDVATQGTIAHGVFEDCFCPENPTHDLSDIHHIMERRIEQYAPFLKEDHRRLEYAQLKTSILKASEEFKALLLHCDANVTKTEEHLTGEIYGIPVGGRTDAILSILGKNLVLDYKKSGSKGRASRMKEGYDHQLFLYREMLNDKDALTAYYTMNDATLVVDQIINCNDNIGVNIKEIENDCTVNASALLEIRIEELMNGDIVLNTKDDNKLWESRGVVAKYSLESTPLIKLFMKPALEEN